MMRELIVASKNKGKLKEIKEILAETPVKILSMDEAGISIDIEENGTTFEENALIKAKAIFDMTEGIVLADDSGLVVDCLDGAPGIYSARFSGENASDGDNINKLLKMMKDIPCEKRTARFVCAVAVILEDGSYFTVKGNCEGVILDEPQGENGFGYDPVFYVPEYEKTMAQLDENTKNSISHRGNALKLFKESILKYLEV